MRIRKIRVGIQPIKKIAPIVKIENKKQPGQQPLKKKKKPVQKKKPRQGPGQILDIQA